MHDSPLMIYAGFLVAGGRVPYRDFFDMNMPGTYFVMSAMGLLFGWDDIGFRAFDLLCLVSISFATFFWMRRFGHLPALAASVAFPLWYLDAGPSMSLQREYIALLPFAAILVIATVRMGFTPVLRFFLTGFLTGASMLIKPHYGVLCVPPMMTAVALLPRSGTKVRVDAVKPRVDEDAYHWNLSHIAEETKRLGIPLLLLLLKDNPIEAYHLKEGIKNLTRSDKMAIAHLTVAVRADNMFSDLARLYLAKVYQAQGNMKKAAEVVVSRSPMRSLHGGRPVRVDTMYNDIMRQVASDHAVELVDAAKVLDEHPYDYIDSCHFNVDGHRRVGELLASRISQILSGGKMSTSQ
jgi:hypothetical protein